MLKSRWLRCLRVVSVKQPVKPWQILRKLNLNRSSVETGRRKFPGQTNLIIALGGMN